MSQDKKKEEKTMKDDRWNTLIEPVQSWVDNFTPVDEDDEDRLEVVKLSMKRGNRNDTKRHGIIKNWRTEFATEIENEEYGFNAWARKSIPKEIVIKMVKAATGETAGRKALWDKCVRKPTFSKKVGDARQLFTHPNFEHFNQHEIDRDVAAFKAIYKKGGDWDAVAPLFEVEKEDSA
jgi:hypothetical protein